MSNKIIIICIATKLVQIINPQKLLWSTKHWDRETETTTTTRTTTRTTRTTKKKNIHTLNWKLLKPKFYFFFSTSQSIAYSLYKGPYCTDTTTIIIIIIIITSHPSTHTSHILTTAGYFFKLLWKTCCKPNTPPQFYTYSHQELSRQLLSTIRSSH